MAEQPKGNQDEEPISIEGDDLLAGDASRTSSVRALGAGGLGKGMKGTQFKRSLNLTGQGATRCRIFRTRVAVAPLEFMVNQINEWLDSEQIEIKHVSEVVGVMEGKTPEPNLILMVWY